METVSVEPATRADVGAIVDAWVALASDQRGHGSHLLAEANRSTVREHITHHVVADRVYVARTPSTDVVGFVQYATEVGTYRMDVDRGIIETIYVDPDHRGQGIGTQLLDRAEAALADADITVVGLEVMARNEDAQRFYRANGYAVHRVGMEKPLENDTH